MMPHSRAPWKIVTAGTQWGCARKGQTRNDTDVCHGSTFDDNWRDDAALIQAAPKMLVALQEALAELLRTGGETRAVKEAIKAATTPYRGDSE